MWLHSYSDYWSIPCCLSEQLFIHQTLCWWSEPFWEFAICTWCKKVYSIESLWLKPEEIDKNYVLTQSCCECDSDLSHMYLNKEFETEIIDYFSWNVNLVLSSEQWILTWFGLTIRKTVQDLLDYELSTRPNSFNTAELGSVISDDLTDEIICFQHIYTIPEMRKTGLWMLILRKMLDSLSQFQDSPVVLETHLQSWGYPLARSLWLDNVYGPDKFGYMVQVAPRLSIIQDLIWTGGNNTQFSPDIFRKFRQEAEEIVQQNPSILQPKKY